ncbi:hypothetical protein TNCV_2587591 [Trichonephila clavipes]|nr:hypothetical protein TNCV_2587591 [Trichonephila clavipes]
MPVRPPANGKPRPKSLRLKGEAAEGESGSLACRTLSMFLPPHLLALPQHQYQVIVIDDSLGDSIFTLVCGRGYSQGLVDGILGVRALVPKNTHHVEKLMHVKSVELKVFPALKYGSLEKECQLT